MAEMMPFLLNVAIIGAQKAATTTLFELLDLHPEVSGCVPKEPHHFDKDDWRARHGAYARRFGPPRQGHRRVTLEASTTYAFLRRSRRSAAHLHAHNPDMKIIFIARDPVDRIISAHRHVVERGYDVPTDIETALPRTPMLVDNTRYASCLEPYRQRFPAGNILVLTFEDVTTRQQDTFARVLGFAGLPPHEPPSIAANRASETKQRHEHDGNRPAEWLMRRAPRLYSATIGHRPAPRSRLSTATARALRRELDPEMARLEAFTERDLGAWRA